MGLFKGLLLASLLVVQVLGNAANADPCSFEFGTKIFEVEEILNCYNSIPAVSTRMESTISSLRELIQTYSFTDIAMSNIAPYNVNVDLAAELDQISQTNYTGDYAFHMALSRLFNKLNDAHTMYYAPTPYRECFGVKAFALSPSSVLGKDEDARINLIKNPLGATIKWNWPINPADYSGRVMAINGQDPRDYLMKYSDHVGTYKDQIVRFNHLFDLVGWGAIDPFTFPVSDIPKEIITVHTADGEVNVTVPVKMFCRKMSYNNTQDFIKQIDTPPSHNKRAIEMPNLTPDLRKERIRRIQGAIEPARTIQVDSEMEQLSIVDRIALAANRFHAKRSTHGAGSLQLIKSVADNSMHLFIYIDERNNVVPVLKVVSFAPETEDDQNAWVNLALNFNTALHNFNWTYAIVDVNKNGGGIICFTLLLQSLMDKRIASVDVHHADVLWTPYNMRKSPMFANIYNKGIKEMDDDYLDMQTGEFDTPKAYYNAETHNISLPNGVKSDLTKFTYFPGSCKQFIAPLLSLVKAWPTNIIVTTDGSCGSACAAFMAKMTTLGSAKIVALGGDTKFSNTVMMRTASFPGGNVVSWSDMSIFTKLTTPFLTSAIARFNWHQAFHSASFDEYPLEYNYGAFAPTHGLRSWKMVMNDDPATDAGVANLINTYESVISLWGDYNQTFPDSTPTPSAYPPWRGPSHSPSSSTEGPSGSTGTTYVALWVVVLVAIAAVIALIMAIVFGVKYAQMKKLVGDESRARLLPYVN